MDLEMLAWRIETGWTCKQHKSPDVSHKTPEIDQHVRIYVLLCSFCFCLMLVLQVKQGYKAFASKVHKGI